MKIVKVFELINGNFENGIWFFQDQLDLKKEVILGLSPTNFHCSLVADDLEFHPRFSFNKSKVYKTNPRRIRAQIFFRFKDIATEDMAIFKDYLIKLKGKYSESCHVGALTALYSGLGLKVNNPAYQLNNKLHPKQFLKMAIEDGFIDRSGNKVNAEFYMVRPQSQEEMFEKVEYFQRKFRWAYLSSSILYFIKRIFISYKVIK